VLRQAFRDLLFGIPGQTEMAFLCGYQGMRLIAEGVDGRGQPFDFGRRKGHGNTLNDSASNAVVPKPLTRLIGDIDDGLF
jgi:AAA domain